MLGAKDEDARERCLGVYKEEKRKVKSCTYQEHFGIKMKQDVNGNSKLFWKEVSKANERKVENYNRIKDGNGRLVLEAAELRMIWKEYYEDLYNIDTQEEVAVHMCGFDEVVRSNYFEGEPIRRTEIEVRVGKFKNGKAAGKDEITGEMIKGGGDRVVAGFGGCVIWLLRVLLCRKTGDLLRSFPCTRVKERGQNAATIEVLAC